MAANESIRFSRQYTERLIKEREPFFKVWDAEWDENQRVLTGFSSIGVAECEGHFPENIYVPLIRISERMAQTGLLLVGALTAGRMNETPIAIGHGSGAALSKRLPRPELNLCIDARKTPWWNPFVVWQKLKIFAALRRKCFAIDMIAYGKWGGMTAHIPVARLRVYYVLIGIPRTNSR